MKATLPKTIRWTRDEFYKMAQAGLFDTRRVELIRGEIFEMSPQQSLHATGIRLVDRGLRQLFGQGYIINVQLPLSLGEDSDPEPDLSVVSGSPRDFLHSHPSGAVLVVEVADSSIEYDRTVKGSLYAEAGIRDYWLLNLLDRRLEVYRDPRPDPAHPFGHGYGDVRILKATDAIAPLVLPKSALKVSDLLP